ncbi:MAG TPA: LysR substrate-binding domain-containing protein, partial [Candidatus Limnocylindrales bacterium]|nr:LysR substrate-binding domain-containing protein [Candidatus Limnocylindrales bacterium]
MAEERSKEVPGLDALELRELRYFLAVAEERNFTRAAERLHLAQQALSASVKRLEDRLGVALFARTTRRVELTSAGEILVQEARAVMGAAAHALERVSLAAEGRTGRLTIGFSTAAGGVGIVRDIIRTFAVGAPDVEIRTVEHDFSDPSAGLADTRVGVAFIFGPLPVEGLSSVTLLEEPRLLAVAPEHPLAGREAVSVADLQDLAWLQVPAQRGPWPEFWFPRPRTGRPGPTIRTADEWVTAIESGRGFAFTMATVMQNFTTARMRVLPVQDLPPAAVLLAWRTSDADPLVTAFVESALATLATRSR